MTNVAFISKIQLKTLEQDGEVWLYAANPEPVKLVLK